MMRFAFSSLLAIAFAGPCLAQDEEKAKDAKAPAAKVDLEPKAVPFKLSKTSHVVVRIKIDGKGPFNVVLDTGCPILIISNDAAKKAGLADKGGIGTIKSLEFEGGLKADNVLALVDTPFQIEGMNNMGLPGIELHGLLGYTVLAKYKMEIDLARERMIWTPLAFNPPGLERPGKNDKGEKNAASANNSVEVMGTFVKIISRFSGLKPAGPGNPRGFVGVELEKGSPKVVAVLADSPAAKAGFKIGDVIATINAGKTEDTIAKADDINAAIAMLRIGQDVTIGVDRGGERVNLKLKTGAGF